MGSARRWLIGYCTSLVSGSRYLLPLSLLLPDSMGVASLAWADSTPVLCIRHQKTRANSASEPTGLLLFCASDGEGLFRNHPPLSALPLRGGRAIGRVHPGGRPLRLRQRDGKPPPTPSPTYNPYTAPREPYFITKKRNPKPQLTPPAPLPPQRPSRPPDPHPLLNLGPRPRPPARHRNRRRAPRAGQHRRHALVLDQRAAQEHGAPRGRGGRGGGCRGGLRGGPV